MVFGVPVQRRLAHLNRNRSPNVLLSGGIDPRHGMGSMRFRALPRLRKKMM